MVGAALLSFTLALWLHAWSPESFFRAAWVPSLNIELRFRADGFGLFFAMLISGIGALVALYSVAYVSDLPGPRLGRYYAALSAFMGAMLGIALADDLILLFVFWEITSITSFLLIGFWYEDEKARAGATVALQVTALGGLAMMVGFVLIGIATGSYSISELSHDAVLRERLTASPLLLPSFVLILAGILTKSAQVPFHFWLPGAMVAPTPVSTYLHAATMVKAGIFLAGRLLPVLGETPYWSPALIGFGLATFCLGAYQAVCETDLKAMLARTTFATLGAILMVYGLRAAEQDALQILSHALYKGTLFLVVGIVEHAAHTRDIRELGGMRRRLPITFAIACLGALSMLGLPPLLGFVAKESLYGELLGSPVLGSVPSLRWAVIALVLAANVLFVVAAAKIVVGVFLGESARDGHADGAHHDEERPALWLPPAVLAAAALGLGLAAASPFTERLLGALSSRPDAHLHASLLPDAPGALALSLLTYLLGAIVFRYRGVLEARRLGAPSIERCWTGAIEAIGAFAEAYSRRWQNGSLRWYFSVTLLFSAGMFVLALAVHAVPIGALRIDFGNLTWYGAILCVLIAASAILVVRATTRIAAALASTAVGFLVASMYVVYRSPDIVLTQILIETVSTIFILLVLYFMPVFRRDGFARSGAAWNGVVSCGTGLVMFLLVLFCTSATFRATDNLAAGYLEQSITQGGGSNAVNVIIVDMRAMDTTGEITVLVVVGLCIYGVLRARRPEA